MQARGVIKARGPTPWVGFQLVAVWRCSNRNFKRCKAVGLAGLPILLESVYVYGILLPL